MNTTKHILTLPNDERRQALERAQESEGPHRCDIGPHEGMPPGRAGAIIRPDGSEPYWQYELDGTLSLYAYESADDALEELQRKLNSREYYFPNDCPDHAPLLVSFHGAGREGESEISRWESVAEREKIVLLAPTSVSPNLHWGISPDDVQKFESLFNRALHNWPIDRNRIYLAGHSAGAHFALKMALHHTDFFAAVAAHSPCYASCFLNPSLFPINARRVPTGIWVGDDDGNRAGGETLEAGLRLQYQVPTQLRVLERHGHRDYHKRPGLPDEMWSFLKQYRL